MNNQIYEKIRKLSSILILVDHTINDSIEQTNLPRKRKSSVKRTDDKQQIINLKDQL